MEFHVQNHGDGLSVTYQGSTRELLQTTEALIGTLYARLPLERAAWFRSTLIEEMVKENGSVWGSGRWGYQRADAVLSLCVGGEKEGEGREQE